MSLSNKDPSLRVAANDPHLVSLGGGRLSTAITIHNIPVGDCTVGSSLRCSISLSGSGVMPVHCTIYRSEDNQVTLVPERNARILIDNNLIKNEVYLTQGAMITIGESYYLRYNNPAEALQIRSAMEETSEKKFQHLDYFCESNFALKACHSGKSTYSYYDKMKNSETPTFLKEWQCPKVFSADLITVNMPAKDVLGQKYASFAKNFAEHHHKDKNICAINTTMNLNKSLSTSKNMLNKVISSSSDLQSNDLHNFIAEKKMMGKDPLGDMLKICTEYTNRQDRLYGTNSGITSSPVVQNRIKTNGSLPRDKIPNFYQEFQSSSNYSNNSLSNSPKSSDYENVSSLQQNNVELVPQSPRTKIRTNCITPKNEYCPTNSAFNQDHTNSDKLHKNYEDLIKTFEENFQNEIKAIEQYSILSLTSKQSSHDSATPSKRKNKNINNLTIDIKSFVSPYNSPTLPKRPTPTPRKINKVGVGTETISNIPCSRSFNDKLESEREDLLERIQCLKSELSSLQLQDNKTLIEMDMEHALIMVELQSRKNIKHNLQNEFHLLQQKVHRLEAQRNATRVMEENQQCKLKHSIEMKQDQVEKLKELLKKKPDDICLKEEISNVWETLENDKKYFEDLEFHYLEGETEWQAYRDDLSLKEQSINAKIEECQLSMETFEKQLQSSSVNVDAKQRRLSNHLIILIKELQQCEEQFNLLEKNLTPKISINSTLSENDQHSSNACGSLVKIMQPLFGSTEMVSRIRNNEDLMSKSLNESMYCNNNIKLLKNELSVNNTKNSSDNFGFKVDTNKIYNVVMKRELQLQLLDTQKGLRNLDYERRKIEDLLKKLNLYVGKLQNFETNQRSFRRNVKSISTQLSKEKQINNDLSASNVSTDAKSGISNKCSPGKSSKELSISSYDSPVGFKINDERSRIVLPHKLYSQGDCLSISHDAQITQLQKQQRPLTRYLPIFTEDFDLRSHIESAGHPISLCPNVFLDAYSCRGYLHKLGSTFRTWAKRWFVLDRRRSAFIYYAEKSERTPRGGAYFSSIDEVYMDHLNAAKSSRLHSTFIVKTKGRSYYLQASSDTAARIWIDVIITGAQGNVEY